MTVEDKVAAGVLWLDLNRPGWEEEIDLHELRMSSPCRCILGQLEGEFWPAACAEAGSHAAVWAVERGFTRFTGSSYSWEDLDEAWSAVVQARKDT